MAPSIWAFWKKAKGEAPVMRYGTGYTDKHVRSHSDGSGSKVVKEFGLPLVQVFFATSCWASGAYIP